jgi:hypothetical protein
MEADMHPAKTKYVKDKPRAPYAEVNDRGRLTHLQRPYVGNELEIREYKYKGTGGKRKPLKMDKLESGTV